MTLTNSAVLSNDGSFSCFSFGNRDIRFKTPRNLVRYLDVREWGNGYLVVDAEYEGMPKTEEYIDLVPILENLYIDPDRFLAPIANVEVCYT